MSELHGTATALLAADDQRYTRSRRLLVEALVAQGRPATLPEILANEEALALSSAYRNLAVLERVGVIRRIVTSDEHARFELAEDLTEHHHHLICDQCGSVEDFTVSPELEATLDAALDAAVKGSGFRPEHHRLDLVGQCGDCVGSVG